MHSVLGPDSGLLVERRRVLHHRRGRRGALALPGDDLVAEPGQQVGQPVVEQALRDTLADLPDVRLRFGSRATGVDQDPDGVTVQVEDADGAASAIRARYGL